MKKKKLLNFVGYSITFLFLAVFLLGCSQSPQQKPIDAAKEKAVKEEAVSSENRVEEQQDPAEKSGQEEVKRKGVKIVIDPKAAEFFKNADDF